jgi:hypothetical protein
MPGKCQNEKCESERLAHLSAKCSDLCFIKIGDKNHDGYVPDDMKVGGGDYVAFDYCLDCGQIQGKFPLRKTGIEREGT